MVRGAAVVRTRSSGAVEMEKCGGAGAGLVETRAGADNGPTTCHHRQLGSSTSHNKHGTQSTFIRKHFKINTAFDQRKKGVCSVLIIEVTTLK